MNQDLTFPLGANETVWLYKALAAKGANVFSRSSSGKTIHVPVERILAIAAEQSRFDFRLLYVLVEFFGRRLETIHPFVLRKHICAMPTPAVWGVLLEFAGKLWKGEDFRSFRDIVLRTIRPAKPQMYWLSQRRPRPEKMAKTIQATPEEFSTWGFYCDEAPLLKELYPIGRAKTFSSAKRRAMLKTLLTSQKSVSVSEYLAALDDSITRQQAHRDLTLFPNIQKLSDRRGRRYYLESDAH